MSERVATSTVRFSTMDLRAEGRGILGGLLRPPSEAGDVNGTGSIIICGIGSMLARYREPEKVVNRKNALLEEMI